MNDGGIKMEDICLMFGKNVRNYRIAKGFSQEEFASRVELHRTYISAVERGRRSISLENIKKIADALEVKVYKLFIFEEEQ